MSTSQPQAPRTERHMRASTKQGRFNARMTKDQKQLFERAAALYGQSVSQFVMSSAQHAAEQAIREHEIINLSARDSRAVMEALAHPAPASEALQQAAERYTSLVSEE